MAIITLNIPDLVVADVVDGIAANNGYQPNVPDPAWVDPEDGSSAPMIPNPVSKNKFARQQLYKWLRGQYVMRKAAEANVTKDAAITQAKADVAGVDEE